MPDHDHDTDDDLDLDLGVAQDVDAAQYRGQVPRLVATLVGAGLGVGLIVVLAAWFFGGVAQTEAGLCRITWAPCTSLSLSSVEGLSGVDLPDGTEVVSGYAQESSASTIFRADVVLPDGAVSPLAPIYQPLEGDWADSVPAVSQRGLSDVRYWFADGDGTNSRVAATGVDAQGHAVILFDTRLFS